MYLFCLMCHTHCCLVPLYSDNFGGGSSSCDYIHQYSSNLVVWGTRNLFIPTICVCGMLGKFNILLAYIHNISIMRPRLLISFSRSPLTIHRLT